MQIAENYLIPKILKELKMNKVQITICKNAINDISMYLNLIKSIVI